LKEEGAVFILFPSYKMIRISKHTAGKFSGSMEEWVDIFLPMTIELCSMTMVSKATPIMRSIKDRID